MTDNSPSAFLLLSLRSRRLIIAAAVIGGALGLAWALSGGKKYRSSAAFVIQESRSSLDALAGLAGQFGVRVPRSGSGLGAEFYRELATSRVTLEPLLALPFRLDEGGPPTPLLELVDVSSALERERVERGVEWLREEAVRSGSNRETGVVRVAVTTRSAVLSHDLAAAVLEQMRRFDVTTRRSQARAEREFLQSRVDSARADLHESERALQVFLERNRSIQDSPQLEVQRERMQRGVTFRQQLLTTIAQAYEQARIDEVRDSPVITVLEPPSLPARREPRGTVAKTGLGAVVGLIIGFLVALVTATVRQAQGPNWTAIRQSWAELRQRRTT